MQESENEKFNFRKGILAGFINYGNEVGRSEIKFKYKIGDETKLFVFSFEVLSTKLNYHEHWRKIIEDISITLVISKNLKNGKRMLKRIPY
jgi:hypothetical protein